MVGLVRVRYRGNVIACGIAILIECYRLIEAYACGIAVCYFISCD